MKLGLVLEGGASRTYFSAGVMDALLELGIFADYVIGSSAGIANGLSYVSNQPGRNLIIGTQYLNNKHYMGMKHFFNPFNRSYYNINYVFKDIPNKHLPFDYEAFKNFKGEVYSAVTDIESGKCEYIKLDKNNPDWTAVVASCALPLMFPPIKLNGKVYMDGGIADPIPYTHAVKSGCDKIITVLTREKDYVKTRETGIGLCGRLYKKHPAFIEALNKRTDLYNESHKTAFELAEKGEMFVFAPKNTEGWKRTERDPEKIRAMYDAGHKLVMDRKEELEAYLKNGVQ
ncbi:MAG: patatin family protein [Clostridia bacterium]|nr:patatin family protein [Clostridia bacterium]